MMPPDLIKYSSYPCHLYGGVDLIEKHLMREVRRCGAERVFVVSSKSVAGRTSLRARVDTTLGGRCVGMFDGITKDSGFPSVEAARDAARAAGADLLVAAGGGSVLVATRAVAILLAEKASPYELMTQYPRSGGAVSPHLSAPKLPIINIPVTPTAAVNRAGVGLHNDELDHRMEFFDPKTRPSAILLDSDLLMATPLAVVRSTATTVFSTALSGVASAYADRLAEGDRLQAFRLARRAYPRLAEGSDGVDSRTDLCVAAFLQNRAEDADRRVVRVGAFAGNYAVSTALHLRFPHVGQGEATSAIATTVMRRATSPDPIEARRAAKALDLWRPGMTPREATLEVAAQVEKIYERVQAPTRVGQLGIPRSELASVAAYTVKNFNANRGGTPPRDTAGESLRLLEAAWS